MLSNGVILLHGNAHTARKTQELLRKFKWEVWSQSPYSPDLASNLGTKLLSGTKFSLHIEVKPAAKNWLYEHGRDFHPAWLNKLFLSSDNYLNKFHDFVEKLSAGMPLNSLLHFLSKIDKYSFITFVNFFGSIPLSFQNGFCDIKVELFASPRENPRLSGEIK
ncbi:hypothetical protein AVEN_24135-1 [Araneus ventricosus]|uniref:Uncharacterized protein n=1 Tax=Araneus ventricosus TaxID=182803 RepID=A0A4Y1ZWD5_ARAVE|nr:hypothetical protein AVEN_24135-1 [Araneus ventricosus]